MLEKYKAAEKMMPWHIKDTVLNANVDAKPYKEGFFYHRQIDPQRHMFIAVDAQGNEHPLFDHEKLCDMLGVDHIPFDACEADDTMVHFVYGDFDYDFDGNTLQKTIHDANKVTGDGKHWVYCQNHNLFVVDETGKKRQLTFDGEENFAYGKCAEYSGYISDGRKDEPDVLFAPDGIHFLTVKLDERGVKDLYILKSYDDENIESIRPRLLTYKCSFPEDDRVPLAYYYIGNVLTGKMTKVDVCGQMSGGRMLGKSNCHARWLKDSRGLYATCVDRGNKKAGLSWLSVSGESRVLVEETSETFLNICTGGQLDGYNGYCASNFVSEDLSTIVWQSERDGYARLYRYGANGDLFNSMTPENIIVGEILYHDDTHVYFYASGLPCTSDPYYQLVCRVGYDGSGFEILTPEDAMHRCVVANGLLVDTYSRVDMVPMTVVRRLDGTFVKELVKADISRLLDKGYVIPERFSVTASDGVTKLYGILVKPQDFDAKKLYPVIDYIYGGMQCYNVPKAFACEPIIKGREVMGGLEAFAALGFAGIILDGLGTPGMGKAFHEHSYQNIHGCAGLKDHVHVLKELKEKYPFLDLERLGIWGNSGGGCATARAMLEYPDVYKVGVASAGNHDQRMYNNIWTENYYGLYDKQIYLQGDNTALAKNLQGRLFIVHGAMDDNVAMSQSLRLVDALIREDKDFDFLILPRVNHNVPADPYFIRRKIDYFVKHLLHEEIPSYRFARPVNK